MTSPAEFVTVDDWTLSEVVDGREEEALQSLANSITWEVTFNQKVSKSFTSVHLKYQQEMNNNGCNKTVLLLYSRYRWILLINIQV